jgi:hypothetical protein
MGMNLEDIMLSEISQSLKDKYYMAPFIFGSREKNSGCKVAGVRRK